MENFKVGDIVRVKDWGESYCYCYTWSGFKDKGFPINYAVRYAYEDDSKFEEYNNNKRDKTNYKILYIKDDIALICENMDECFRNNKPTYLVSFKGLVNITDIHKMTIADIENELGYCIEIIKEEE